MTRRLIRAAMLALAATTMAAEARAAEPSIERGRVIVQRNCAGCHGVGVRGKSPLPAAPLFRELHSRYAVEMLAEALAEGILTGHPAMPEFTFPPRDINDIIAYLKSIQTRGDARRGTGNPADPRSPA